MSKNKQCQYHQWDKHDPECFCPAKHSMVVTAGALEIETDVSRSIIDMHHNKDVFRLCNRHFEQMERLTKYSREYHADEAYGGNRRVWYTFKAKDYGPGSTVNVSIRLRRNRL